MTLQKDALDPVLEWIKNALPNGGVVVLQGDLASGKTTLTQSFASSLGIDEAVTSPTFSLQQCYGDALFHYDIYNHGFEHFLALGMLEELEKPGYHFIEWGDAQLKALLKSAMIPMVSIKISKNSEDSRQYELSA
ncbi:MAG TPA: tRNA (adenosine(37)-N6)-threonylcarbamoyltransferase complex ATPase subunit type 1 TsaE [Helicobacteraceae bacterium]|nr:tRNA (adenosine(37)-N6)-threonylcarbamoyltransferase complex ATPase subunit type 1 TsaE [Helicobacteraceae bacterium]